WNNSHNSSGTNRSTIPTMTHRIPSHPNEMASKKSVLRNESMGIKFTGRPEMKPQVTAVNTEGKTATVTDCFDATSWKPVYKDSGKKLKLAEQRLKYPVTSQATLGGDTWFVTRVTADRTKGC
ncbi:hypothetical protein ACFVWE_31660, partial [Streptomyces albidoflavus]